MPKSIFCDCFATSELEPSRGPFSDRRRPGRRCRTSGTRRRRAEQRRRSPGLLSSRRLYPLVSSFVENHEISSNKIFARDWRAFNLVLTECSERGRKEEGQEKKRDERKEEEGRERRGRGKEHCEVKFSIVFERRDRSRHRHRSIRRRKTTFD